MYIFGNKICRFSPKKGNFSKSLKLPQKDFIWSLQTKNGDAGWRNPAWTAKKLILAKNVHFRLQNWPFLTQKMGIFQNRLNFLKTTLFEAYKPKMVMLGEEMRPALRKNWF